ncbi:unnamed protein product [Polarella glacialis]|uniref:Signal recognition particle 19 kDa protein n=1 Tax=Polarella glacialis TaxID=89957 RepID=A0A813F1S2_POLGL|nr:unnamed protein product [Polarella glacialis]
MAELDTSKWNVLYPNYINSKKTVPEGRRIGLEKGVEHPRPQEMAEVCEFLKIPHVLEMGKSYPRDWMPDGRVRVLLKTPEGKVTHPEIHTKKALMLKMGELIPKLTSRANGPLPPAIPGLELLGPQAASAAPSAAASAEGAPQGREARKEAKRAENKANKKKK